MTKVALSRQLEEDLKSYPELEDRIEDFKKACKQGTYHQFLEENQDFACAIAEYAKRFSSDH